MRKSSADQVPQPPKVDRRLIGSWKSDGPRTRRDWRWRKPLSAKKSEAFLKLFGRLELTYTRNWVSMRIGGYDGKQRYQLLGSDETSIAILAYGGVKIKDRTRYSAESLDILQQVASEATIQHIHFDKSGFWISLGGNREFFKRVKPHASRRRSKRK